MGKQQLMWLVWVLLASATIAIPIMELARH